MNRAASAPVSLLRFRAGQLELGIVAAAAERLVESSADCPHDCPHISELLGVEASRDPAEPRTLTLSAYGKRGRLIIDTPIRIASIDARDLLASSRALRRGRSPAVLGFAQDAAHIVLLLDVAWLVEKAC